MHPNESLIRRLYQARANGDLDTVRAILDEAIVWHEPALYGGFAGDHSGTDAVVREVFERYDDYEGSALELHDVLANDAHVVALVSWWVRRAGARVDGREIAVYHVHDARVTEAWFFPDADYRDFFA